MEQDRHLHVLHSLHFTDNNNEPNMMDENSDRLWKISVWNSEHDIFKILWPFRTSDHRWSYCFVQRKGHFPTIYTQETQTFWHQNLQTMWWDWIHVWYNTLCGQRQTANCTTPDCNSRDSIRTDKENTRMWPQTVYGQLLFLPRLIQWLGHEALSDPTGQGCHRSYGPRKWHSNMVTFKYSLGATWQQYCWGTNAIYICWQTFTMSWHRIISAITTGRHKVANCGWF